MSKRSTTHATFVIERSYEASPARVFAAWADRTQKERWFGPSSTEVPREMEFHVGGREHFIAEVAGATYAYDARYQDIVPDERIVYSYDMLRDETRISVSLATVEFKPAGEGTALLYTEQGVYLDGADTPEAREHGTRELLQKLEAELRGTTASV